MLPQVKPTVFSKENKEEEEKVILICPSPPLDDKSTTTLSSNELMVSASKNPNIQLSEEIDDLITCLKQFKALSNITHFLPPTEYYTITRNRENSFRYWNWIIKGLLKSKQNSETVQRGFKIPLYIGGLSHEPWFISKAADNSYIVGLQKKSVAIYAMGEEKL